MLIQACCLTGMVSPVPNPLLAVPSLCFRGTKSKHPPSHGVSELRFEPLCASSCAQTTGQALSSVSGDKQRFAPTEPPAGTHEQGLQSPAREQSLAHGPFLRKCGEDRSQVSQILVSSSNSCMRHGHMSGMNTWGEHEVKMKHSGAEMGIATLSTVKGLEWDPWPWNGTSVPHLPPLLLLETGL